MAYGNRFGGGSRFNERRSFAPVKVGDELDVKIEAVGEKGDGIAKKDGFVLFVPNAKEGDELKVKVTKVLRRVGFAEIVGKGKVETKDEKPAKAAKSKEKPKEEAEEDSEEYSDEESEEEPEASDKEEFSDSEEEAEEDSEDFGE